MLIYTIGSIMSQQTLNFSSELYNYYLQNTLREPEILKKLRLATQTIPGAQMQICAEQGQLMAFLVEIINARKTLDIGTFTGYSALVVALALSHDAEIHSFDIDAKTSKIAQEYWQAAGMQQKINLHLGPATEQLQHLIKTEENTFDFAFIDADKANYDTYYEQCLRLLRPGGVIAIDNVLWDGKVADHKINDNSTQAIRHLNQKILYDKRVTYSMIPIGDGLSLIKKR